MRTLANRGCLIRDAPFSLVRSSVAVPQNVLLGDRGAGKTFKTKITHFAVYARVNQSVTGCYKFVVEPGSPVYPPSRRPGLLLALIHPSAWKMNSQKSISRILHRNLVTPMESAVSRI
jgi:hypothetical protein